MFGKQCKSWCDWRLCDEANTWNSQSDKVIQRVVTHVNQENQVDGAALHHDIAYKQQQYDEVQIKINNLIKTIEDNPDLTSVIRPSIQNMKSNSMTLRIKSTNSKSTKWR